MGWKRVHLNLYIDGKRPGCVRRAILTPDRFHLLQKFGAVGAHDLGLDRPERFGKNAEHLEQ